MDYSEYKKQFALALLKMPDEPFKAALQVFPDDTAFALRVCNEWVNDPEVLAHKEDICDDDGELAFLPNKAVLCRAIWQRMKNTRDPDAYCKLAKLYADVRAFIPKQEQSVNVQVNHNKVMIIKDHGTDGDWEHKLIQQQTALSNGNYSAVN